MTTTEATTDPALKRCIECGHTWNDHVNWPGHTTHCTHGEEGEYDAGAERILSVGGCECSDFDERDSVEVLRRRIFDLMDARAEERERHELLIEDGDRALRIVLNERNEARAVAADLAARLSARVGINHDIEWGDQPMILSTPGQQP